MQNYDVVVIGGGPAGLAAAVEARKHGAESILVLERDRELGGILQQCIHNGFGLHVFKEELTGPEYAERFIEELKSLGISYLLDTMVLELTPEKILRVAGTKQGYFEIQARAVILCMGCRERTRGAIAIPGTRPAGVMNAGAAQRYVNMEGYMVGKRIVILGSGDIGLIMARRMTLEGAKVLAVAELMPFSSGLTRNIVQCLHDYNIPLYLSHTVTEIRGKDRVEGVVISKVDDSFKPIPGTEMDFVCDTLLLSVGLIPENELSRSAGIRIDPATNGPVVNEAMETSVSGIFACGNVVHVHDLVDWVTAESRRAGKYAALYVKNVLQEEAASFQTVAGSGISYIVPHTVRPANVEKELILMMRPRKVYHKAELLVKADGVEIRRIKRPHMAPGEMENVTLQLSSINTIGLKTVSVEVVEGSH
ncbi:MAG: FAD-dependent oxidoreductase [Candidatus Riflebacteria bacterium]|nr:FAD-dependent oxidoreductase [Candidatus Riflebacteria bacterium]